DEAFEFRVAELAARDVDAGEQRRFERKETLPACQIARGAFQRETAEIDDQPARFGMRNEIGRRDQSFYRMMPAQQRFEPGERAVFQTDDRLIEHVELVLFERLPEFGFETHAVARCECGEIADIDARATAALPLGLQ